MLPHGLTRRHVLWLACSLSMITYLDRVCFAFAIPFLVSELGLEGIADLKWAFTAFTLAYASFEIPSGWLGDKFGPRKTLIRIVLGWSLFTMLTGLVGLKLGSEESGGVWILGGVWTLCVIRFLFGMGEAGAYPNLARVVANWFPAEERGRAKGTIWMSGRFMGGITPLIWMVLVVGMKIGERETPALMSWRAAFLLFGLIGFGWCFVFARRFHDYPSGEHPDDTSHKSAGKAAEKASVVANPPAAVAHNSLPWKIMLANRNLWLLGLMYACASFSWYFNITYFPSFLKTRFGLQADSISAGIMAGGPLLLGGLGCLIGGHWTDGLLRLWGNRRWARRVPPMFGHAACGVCYLLAIVTQSAWPAALAISLAAFANDLMMGSAWASCQDIGRRNTAVVAGWMNTCGNLGGALSGWAIGTILQSQTASRAMAEHVKVSALSDLDRQAAELAGYELCFYVFAAVSLLATLTWFGIRADEPLIAE